MNGNYEDFPHKNRPLIGNFEITRRCPFNCPICYNDKSKKEEMTTTEIVSILDDVASMGCLHINLTGGDPLIRKDFDEIYMALIERGIRPSIETELFNLEDSTLRLLEKYKPYLVRVSVYGIHDSCFQRASGTNFSSKRVLDNIDKLVMCGIPVKARTPFTKLNITDAIDLYEYFSRKKIPYAATTKIFWSQTGVKRDMYRCSVNDFESLQQDSKIVQYLLKMTKDLENKKINKHSCDTEIFDFNITPYGTLSFCITFWQTEYDLRKGSFQDAWKNWYPQYRRSENNYCLGKKIFDCQDSCPWSIFYYSNEKVVPTDLIKCAKEKIEMLKQSGFDDLAIQKQLALDNDTYRLIEESKD